MIAKLKRKIFINWLSLKNSMFCLLYWLKSFYQIKPCICFLHCAKTQLMYRHSPAELLVWFLFTMNQYENLVLSSEQWSKIALFFDLFGYQEKYYTFFFSSSLTWADIQNISYNSHFLPSLVKIHCQRHSHPIITISNLYFRSFHCLSLSERLLDCNKKWLPI